MATTFAQDEFTGPLRQGAGLLEELPLAPRTPSRKDDVLRVAKKYLTPDKLVILVVGQKDEILLGYPDHPVKAARTWPAVS